MNIRNVQKTGDMHYVYLPTAWCKEHKISSDSKVTIETGAKGSLVLSPNIIKKKAKSIELNILNIDQESLNKLIVSCFINPAESFRIKLDKEMNYTKLLKQKKLISIESIELDGKTIVCESSVAVENPDLLLRTMVNKIKNMIIVISNEYNKELIEKFEEEIDRIRLMIDKSVISCLTFYTTTKLKMIDVHYIATLSNSLERLADHLILIDQKEKHFLDLLLKNMNILKVIVDQIVEEGETFNYEAALGFINDVRKTKNASTDKTADIVNHLSDTTEVLLDWAITKKIEEDEAKRKN